MNTPSGSQPSKSKTTNAGIGITDITTFTRATGNLGMKAGLVAEASIVGKNLGIAPEVSSAIAEVADKLPNALNISTEIPGIGDVIEGIINSSPTLQNAASDLHNAANIGVYASAFGLLYFLSRLGFGEKGRFEAGTSAVVWTALSCGLLGEMADVIKGEGKDIMRVVLPVYDYIPFAGENGEKMIDPEFRKSYYGVITGFLGSISTLMAGKNIKRVFTGIPSKDKK